MGTAGVVVVFVGHAMMFFDNLPAVLLSPDGSRGLMLAGQDLGFLRALMARVGAVPLGIALLRARPPTRAGALLLIVALPVGIVGMIIVSGRGFANIAGLPLTVLYGEPG